MKINIKPIRTESEYQILLNQIDTLVDCPEGSPEEDLLEVLSILADDFENKHYPMANPDPIEAIKLSPLFWERKQGIRSTKSKKTTYLFYGQKIVSRLWDTRLNFIIKLI
jgi:hypothetical protein